MLISEERIIAELNKATLPGTKTSSIPSVTNPLTNFPNIYIFDGKLSIKKKDNVDKSLYLSNEYGKEDSLNSLKKIFKQCNSKNIAVIEITLENYIQIIEELKKKYSNGESMCIINLCDGTEVDGYPGLSIVSMLETSNIPYSGSDPLFYELTTSKPTLKKKLLEKNVSTSEFVEVRKNFEKEDLELAGEKLGFPVIIKPAVSYASLSINKGNVVRSVTSEAVELLKETVIKNPDGVFIEEYLAGREFTVLVTGDSMVGIKAYLPAERVFNKKLGKFERFLAFDRYWDGYDLDGNAPDGSAESFYWYAPAPIEWQQELIKLAVNAYNACGGNGYGRVDIRTRCLEKLDAFVLEVNANCGISGSSTTTEILKLSNVLPDAFFSDLVLYSLVLYGGDEVSGLVFDFGCTSSKIGYAGEDCPRAVFPSYVGYDQNIIDNEKMEIDSKERKKRNVLLGENNTYKYKPNVEFKNPFKNGVVEDWDAFEDIWEYSYTNRLRTVPEHHPLLMSESSWANKESREKMLEMAFETFNVPAFYLAQNAVLSAFSAGKSNALVIDSGGENTSVTPVYDGYVLRKGVQKQNLAGEFVSNQAALYLKQELGFDIIPQYQISKKYPVDAVSEVDQPARYELKDTPNAHPSFHDLNVKKALHEFKETICSNLEVPFDSRIAQSRPKKCYEFTTGFNTSFARLRYMIPECLFDPKFILPAVTDPVANSSFAQPIVGVHHLAHQSVMLCDQDIRTIMYTNVVLTGGNTLLNGFAERLHCELNLLAPGIKVRLHSPANLIEKRFGSWIGGSILASLGTFHQLWISKKEYEEFGASILDKR
ncbi:Actin-like protein 6B [Lobulomyces angularis]|nr:Actin-like protein 6B [Lobulomyces angularis]